MALLEREHEQHDHEGPGARPDPKHRDNLVIIVIGIAGVILTYLLYRANKAQGSRSTAAPIYPASSGTVAGQGYTSDPYTEAMVQQLGAQEQANGQALQGFQQLLQTLTSELSGPPAGGTPSQPASPPPTSPSAGFGLVQTAQGLMVDLGQYTGPAGGFVGADFHGYGVTGGAPTYFGNASSLETGQAQPGEVYTPAQYAPQVSPTRV